MNDPVSEARPRMVALNLMRMAIALLDRADETAAATRLQHAIDTLEGKQPGVPDSAEIERLLGS